MEPLALLAHGVTMAAATAEVTGVLKRLDIADSPESEFVIARVQDTLVASARPALLVSAVAVSLGTAPRLCQRRQSPAHAQCSARAGDRRSGRARRQPRSV